MHLREYPKPEKPLGWSSTSPPYPIERLVGGIAPGEGEPGYMVTARDLDVLEMLWEHSYLMLRHLPFTSRRDGVRRMQTLHRLGMVAKCEPGGYFKRQMVYSLTRFGAGVLELKGVEVPSTWNPPYERSGIRDNAIHQIEVADFCLVVLDEVRGWGFESPEWVGSRALIRKIHPMYAGGQGVVVIPDSGIWLDFKLTLLIEHEREWHAHKFAEKMDNYRRYLAGDTWHVFGSKPPVVLLSIDDSQSKTVFDRACEAAFKTVSRVALIPSSRWRAGDLAVTVHGMKGTSTLPIKEALAHYLS